MKIVAVRVPEETKKKMKHIAEDWSKYLRGAIEERIRQEENKEVLADLRRLWKRMPKTPSGFGARSVREDRDRR